MRMPSLIKYFAVVGSVLLGLLFLVNHLAGPQASDGKEAAVAPAPKTVVPNDPRASAVERWRNQLAAMRAAEQTPTAENASTASKSAPELAGPTHTAAVALQPAAQSAPVETPKSISEAAAIITPSIAAPAPAPDEASAAKAAAEKARIAKARTAKAKLARDRAAATRMAAGEGGVPVAGHFNPLRERSASNLQDQYYYGQRSASAQPAPSQGYAYAPQRSYGPFGGFGRGW